MHTARLSRTRRRRRDFPDRDGDDGATKIIFLTTEVDTVQLSRPRRRRRYFPDHRGDGATRNSFLATKAETARLSRPRRRRSDFPDRGGDGATRKNFFANVVDAARLYQSGFRPKLHCRAESLSLESLDTRSGKSGHESRQGSRRIRI